MFNFITFEKRNIAKEDTTEFESYEINKEEEKEYKPALTFQIKSNAEALSSFKKPNNPKAKKVIKLRNTKININFQITEVIVPTEIPILNEDLNKIEQLEIKNNLIQLSKVNTKDGNTYKKYKEHREYNKYWKNFKNSKEYKESLLSDTKFQDEFGYRINKDKVVLAIDQSPSCIHAKDHWKTIKLILLEFKKREYAQDIFIYGFSTHINSVFKSNGIPLNVDEIMKKLKLNSEDHKMTGVKDEIMHVFKMASLIRPKQTIIICDRGITDFREWNKALNSERRKYLGEICITQLKTLGGYYPNSNLIPDYINQEFYKKELNRYE